MQLFLPWNHSSIKDLAAISTMLNITVINKQFGICVVLNPV